MRDYFVKTCDALLILDVAKAKEIKA